MATQSTATTVDELDLGSTNRHLVHRSPSWDHYLLDSPSVGEEHFTLTGAMPLRHPLFNDGPGHFHDFQVIAEIIGEMGEFVGQRYFGVPTDRTGLFYRFALELTDLERWRSRPAGPQLTTQLRIRPTRVVGGVPRSLEFQCEAHLDGTRCLTGNASLLFLAPVLSRNYSRLSRGTALDLAGRQEADGPAPQPADPSEVGRTDPRNVVVSEPTEATGYRLTTQVLAPPHHQVFATAADEDHVAGLLLLEALRQTALLTAGRTYGFTAARSTLGSVNVHFRGYAEQELPLRCVAVPGLLGHDVHGRPSVPVTLTVAQHGRVVAEATATVLQDS